MNRAFEWKSDKSFLLDHSLFQSPRNVDTHIHDCYELFYFLSGDLTYYIEGHAYKLEPHDMIITNTRELHRIVFDSDADYARKYIHVKSDYLTASHTREYNPLNDTEHSRLGHDNRISKQDVVGEGIDKLWEKVEQAYFEKTPERSMLLKTYFIQMMIKSNNIAARYN